MAERYMFPAMQVDGHAGFARTDRSQQASEVIARRWAPISGSETTCITSAQIGASNDSTPAYGVQVNVNGGKRFLTIDQVAEELNVGLPSVRALLKSGELRGIQVGGRGLWRVGIADLDDYIAQAYRSTAEEVVAGEIDDEDSDM